MLKYEGYMAGANLGHWISQAKPDEEHFNTYITKKDILRAAKLGFDHLRLPVDYFFFEKFKEPGVFIEERLAYIDNTIAWCKEAGINLVLDLHHAPGFSFGFGLKNTLFNDPAQQEDFINIWRMFAKRYASEGKHLVFELMNELVWDSSDPWNALWPKAAAAIHEIDPERCIIVGGNQNNSVDELVNLAYTDDPRIWYTFHFYHPMIFSHQKAFWYEPTRLYQHTVNYPINSDENAEYYRGVRPVYEDMPILDKRFLEARLTPAAEFIEKTKRPLYCGEYGVIAAAPLDGTIRWHNDLADVLLSMGIGRAVWSLRGFANITDANNEVVSEDLIRAVTRK